MERRLFLKHSLLLVSGVTLGAGTYELLAGAEVLAAHPEMRWGFLVDTTRCVGCGFCVRACKLENDVPLEANVSRTWVERYVMLKDGEVLADAPRSGQDGYRSPVIDRNAAGPRPYVETEVAQGFFVPKLCNQCDNPPCVQVCPVGATYQTADGVVLVDRRWCIGCGYCIMGCPYGVRFFHPVVHVADKCTFCYHRLHRGLATACVQACPFGARRIGNLRDPSDPLTQTVLTARVGVLKDEYGTKPQVFYLGLSKEVR